MISSTKDSLKNTIQKKECALPHVILQPDDEKFSWVMLNREVFPDFSGFVAQDNQLSMIVLIVI